MAAPIALCDTAGMSRERWLECRMHGPNGDIPYTVGGSDVAAIFGVSPWVTPKELWLIKKGRMNPAKKINALQLEMGHLLEPIAAHFYAQKTGNKVFDDTTLYQHADHPYALADLDRSYIRKEDNAEGVLECKSCTFHNAAHWADGKYPLYYELQLRFYLSVKDVRYGAFSAIWGNNPDTDMAMPELERDQAMEDDIFERLDRWIWSLVHDVEPTMDGIVPKLALEALARIYGSGDPKRPTIEFPKSYEDTVRRIYTLQTSIDAHKTKISELEEEVDAQSVRIAELMKAHEHGVLETTTDKFLIDFVTRITRRPNSSLLKERYPEVYSEVLKSTESRKVKVSLKH